MLKRQKDRRRHQEGTLLHSAPLADLQQHGLHVLRGYVPRELVLRAREEVEPVLRDALGGSLARNLDISVTDGYAEVLGAERYFDAVREIAEDPLFLEAARAYGGPSVASYRVRAVLRVGGASNPIVDPLHIDTWAFRFKAMVYLSDVGPEDSPLKYVPGTHGSAGWALGRPIYEYLCHVNKLRPVRERLLQRRAHHGQPYLCTGPAGTAILFDTRGIHAGTPGRGDRLILNQTFTAFGK